MPGVPRTVIPPDRAHVERWETVTQTVERYGEVMLAFVPVESMAGLWYRYNATVRNPRSERVSIPGIGSHYFGEMRPRDMLVPAKVVPFEGGSARVPARPKDYLEARYGAKWSVIQPESESERHVVMELELGEAEDGYV